LRIYLNGDYPGPFVAFDVAVCRMLDKTGQTGSPLQLVNGLVLIRTFACARLGYGWIMVRDSFDLCVQYNTGLSHARTLPSRFNFSKR
jgi:hypothetical protein